MMNREEIMFKGKFFSRKSKMNCRILFITSIVVSLFASLAVAQDSTNSDSNVFNGYEIRTAVEIGVRGLDVDGSLSKFRSDLNYRNGVRLFDSSFSMKNTSGHRRFFDQVTINASGWGADRTGYASVNAESSGLYKFNGKIRRIAYFSDLNNHALNQHNFNTNRDLGDFDLTVYPMADKFRLNFGASYDLSKGPGTWNSRAYRDDFKTSVNNNTNSYDFRVGIEGNLLGFNLSATQGYRRFRERSQYILEAPTVGNNTTDTTQFFTFFRQFPITGTSYFTAFNAQRTFAKRVDFTARIIYSDTKTRSSIHEEITGRDNSNNWVDLDQFDISGDASRPQFRGDLGLTFNVTDNFRISNTFSFDRFRIDGGEYLFEQLFRRNAAGTVLAPSLTNSSAYRVTNFERYINTIEGDWQIKNWVGLHLGYRYTHRKVDLFGYDQRLPSAPSFITEEEKNSTNTLIAGMKIKPTKWWALFWDIEHGDADNVFTRVENYKFTNFRVRSRMSIDKFVLNLSGISKDNTNPTGSSTGTIDFSVNSKSRIYSGSLDWNPDPRFWLTTGYTYTHITSIAAIVVNSPARQGVSQYFVRDHSFFIDASARANKWVSFFGSYRINKDVGQGDRPLLDPYPILIGNTTTPLTRPQDILSSYPLTFQSPEFRVAFRITKNIDWNIGYQYYDYKEKFQTIQDYKAHLPYTSLKIYFGNADR